MPPTARAAPRGSWAREGNPTRRMPATSRSDAGGVHTSKKYEAPAAPQPPQGTFSQSPSSRAHCFLRLPSSAERRRTSRRVALSDDDWHRSETRCDSRRCHRRSVALSAADTRRSPPPESGTLLPMRVILYTGKGGVGKTTTAAATAAHAASRGARVLVLSADPAHSLGDVLGERLGPEPRRVAAPRAPAGRGSRSRPSRSTRPRRWSGTGARSATSSWLALPPPGHRRGRGREELALLPGAEELSALLAVEEAARGDAFDLVRRRLRADRLRAPAPHAARDGAQRVPRCSCACSSAVATVVSPLASSVFADSAARTPRCSATSRQLLFRRLARLRRLLLVEPHERPPRRHARAHGDRRGAPRAHGSRALRAAAATRS